MRAFLAFTFILASLVFIIGDVSAEPVSGVHTELETIPLNLGSDHGELVHHDELHDDHETKKGGLPQLDASTFASQLFWLAITFSALLFMLSKRYLPKIANTLEERRAHIQTNLDDAEQLKSEAEDAQRNYDEMMKGAYEQSSNIMNEVNESIKGSAEDMLKNFRVRSNAAIEETDKNLETAKNTVMKDIEAIATDVSLMSLKKLAGMDEDAKTVEKYIYSSNKKAA